MGKLEIWRLLLSSWKHFSTEVTPSLHLKVEMGKIWGWYQNDEKWNFWYFS